MKNLKLMVAEGNLLNEKEMNAVRGGSNEKPSCGCACAYADKGGSSTADNKAANDAKGLHSPGMIHVIGHFNDDGSETLCDYWIKIVP